VIEKATANDIPGIVKIIIEFQVEKSPSQDLEAISIGAAGQLQACLDDPKKRSIYVARGADDKVLGYLVVHWIPFPALPGFEGYISDLIVASKARGQGLGRALLQAAEEEAKSNGATRLMLNNRKSADSYDRQFYAKLGFSERIEFANFVKSLVSK